MRNIPLSVLLSFPSPNYKSAVTRGPAAVITVLILSCFVVIAVSLRVYTRVRVQSWSGMDDLFIVLAVVRRFTHCSGPLLMYISCPPLGLTYRLSLLWTSMVGIIMSMTFHQAYLRVSLDVELSWIELTLCCSFWSYYLHCKTSLLRCYVISAPFTTEFLLPTRSWGREESVPLCASCLRGPGDYLTDMLSVPECFCVHVSSIPVSKSQVRAERSFYPVLFLIIGATLQNQIKNAMTRDAQVSWSPSSIALRTLLSPAFQYLWSYHSTCPYGTASLF